MLTAQQWSLAENLCLLLKLFETETQRLNSASDCASDIIPTASVLRHTVTKMKANRLLTLRRELLHMMDDRFSPYERTEFLAVATLLDPRYKLAFFSSAANANAAKHALQQKFSKVEDLTGADASSDDQDTTAQPDTDDPWDFFTARPSTTELTESSMLEVDMYLSETAVPRRSMDDPLEYWRVHNPKWPTLGKMVRRFLTPPATSVPSERTFSTQYRWGHRKPQTIQADVREC